MYIYVFILFIELVSKLVIGMELPTPKLHRKRAGTLRLNAYVYMHLQIYMYIYVYICIYFIYLVGELVSYRYGVANTEGTPQTRRYATMYRYRYMYICICIYI